MINSNILDGFSDYLRENEKSEKTIESYSSDVAQFLKYIGEDLNNLNKDTVNKYKDNLKNMGRSIKTINRKLVSLHQYIEFMNDIHAANISVKIKQEKIQQQDFIDDMMETNDVIRMIRAAEKENDIRAKALFYTLYYTGARISEALQIKLTDIAKDSIMVKGKGSKYRPLLITKKLTAIWKEYTKTRCDKSEFLFTGERGAINRQTAHNNIKYYVGKARGIDKDKCHAHSFRHLYAQNLSELGIDPIIISQLLGHQLSVTGIYVQQSKRELLKMLDKLDLKTSNEK